MLSGTTRGNEDKRNGRDKVYVPGREGGHGKYSPRNCGAPRTPQNPGEGGVWETREGEMEECGPD